MTLATVLLLAAFVSLGRWQWHRGETKQQLWTEFEHAATEPPIDVPSDLDTVPRYRQVRMRGRFDGAHQFLFDNRFHQGKPGYEVLTPFELTDGRRILVNRGWLPFLGYRDRLPDVSIAAAQLEPDISVSGRLDELPVAGLASGRAPPTPDAGWPKLTSFPTQAELEAALGERIQKRIVLMVGQGDGYVREWSAPGLSPDRHFSYAIQWWGFALVLLVLYFGLNFRKVS